MHYSIILLSIVLVFTSCNFKSKQSIETKEGVPSIIKSDALVFKKELSFQGIQFSISSIKETHSTKLIVLSKGLEVREYNETIDLEGDIIINAEVEDLNNDGSPELLIFTQSVGSGSYGNVYAFSVNNKKSMSQVYFQPTADNKAINNGYMGHDEFSLVEHSLVQRFPIYKEGDSNANPTGGTRQISYELVDGEASRKFVVKRITHF